MVSFGQYLKPTRLCDFDKAPEIGSTAKMLAQGRERQRQKFDRIFQFVKGLPYGLEDWNVKASDTLRKGWGMCSGKSNLLIAMSRSLGIPARYRIIKIKAEGTLWRWVAKQDSGLGRQMGEAEPQQDHIVAEIHLDGWEVYDTSRDPAFEQGLRRLEIPLERRLVTAASGNPQVLILASIDEWAQKRQRARRFREDRQSIFSRVNEQFDRIRALAKR
jgi:hypothetical protein